MSASSKYGELINRIWFKFVSQLTLLFLVAVLKHYTLSQPTVSAITNYLETYYTKSGYLYRRFKYILLQPRRGYFTSATQCI